MKLSIPMTVFLAILALSAVAQEPLILDNDSGAPVYLDSGAWVTSSYTGYAEGTYRTVRSVDELSSATWAGQVATAGSYEVFAIFRAGTNRTSSAPYRIAHASGTAQVAISQLGQNEMVERFLGEFYFVPLEPAVISLTNEDGENYFIADAIRIAPAVDDPPVISDIVHLVGLPSSTDPAPISAQIRDPDIGGGIASATLIYSSTPSGLQGMAPLLDQGIPPDTIAGDSIYAASIPSMPTGEKVSYRVLATDITGQSATSEVQEYYSGALDEPAWTFIIAGQSNASGRGELNENTERPDARILLFGNDYHWKVAYEPVDDPSGQLDSVSDDSAVITAIKGHSFGLRAGKELLGSGTSFIRLIPCPLGATNISQWRKTANPFDRGTLFGSCNYRRFLATPGGGQPTALWWYQGEREAGTAALRDAFIANHTALIGDFRSEMGEGLPVVYVQLARLNTNHQIIGEYQRRLETGSGYPEALERHFMAVAFDLPMADSVHLDQAGQKELGRRIGLATRQHVFGEEIDGTGPRLLLESPLIHPGGEKRLVAVRFNQPIKDSSNEYEGQFRVFDGGVEVQPLLVSRDAMDPARVLIQLSSEPSGSVTVSYGDFSTAALHIPLSEVVKGANDLPAPRFGPLAVEMEDLSITNWQVR